MTPWLPTTFKTPLSSGKPGDEPSWKSDFQEFQSPLAWHTEEECWERVRSRGNLQEIWYEQIQQLEWLELFGGVKCWVWHCEDPSNSGSNESFYSLWSRFFQQLKTQFSPGSIFSGCGEDSYFDATFFSEISVGGSTTIEKRIFGTTSKEMQHPRDSGPEMIVKNGGWCTKNHTQIRSEGIIQLKMKSDLLDGVHSMTT